jgi:dipeptidase D
MNQEIRLLEPQILWNFFADVNAVPRPSKKEEKLLHTCNNLGKALA